MPALRQMSATGTPSLPCFRMNAFCASENFDAFIVFRSSQPGNQTRKTLAKNGPVCGEQINLRDGPMKRSRFTEDQIIAVLREHEAGARRLIWRASMGFRKRRCTTGRPSTA